MRPTKAVCIWCNAEGVVFAALPGSLCHECGRRWVVSLWHDMTDDQLIAACARLGRTTAEFFGVPVRRPLFEVLKEDFKRSLAEAKLRIQAAMLENFAEQIDLEALQSLYDEQAGTFDVTISMKRPT